MARRKYPSLYGDEIAKAREEFRTALGEVRPGKPYGPDYRGIMRAITRDRAKLDAIFQARRAYHLEQGLDDMMASQMAQKDLEDFAQRWGGES